MTFPREQLGREHTHVAISHTLDAFGITFSASSGLNPLHATFTAWWALGGPVSLWTRPWRANRVVQGIGKTNCDAEVGNVFAAAAVAIKLCRSVGTCSHATTQRLSVRQLMASSHAGESRSPNFEVMYGNDPWIKRKHMCAVCYRTPATQCGLRVSFDRRNTSTCNNSTTRSISRRLPFVIYSCASRSESPTQCIRDPWRSF